MYVLKNIFFLFTLFATFSMVFIDPGLTFGASGQVWASNLQTLVDLIY